MGSLPPGQKFGPPPGYLWHSEKGAVSDLADRALNVLSEARRERRSVDKAAGAALLSVWQSDAILRQARANPQRVADGTLGISEFRRKSTLMARSLTGWW